jgi:hypothetical protein
LISLPTSWTTTKSCSVFWPVSGSISIRASSAAKAGAWTETPAAPSPMVGPSGEAMAVVFLAMALSVIDLSGTPLTTTRSPSMSRSSIAASSSSEATLSVFSRASFAAASTAVPTE